MVRPGHGSDGPQGNEFADFVRHALHAAADHVEPGPDGLQQIREKIRSRPAHARARRFRLALGVSAVLGILGDLALRWYAALIRTWRGLRHGQTAPGTHRAKPQQSQRPRDWREAILRPAFAVGFAVFAVGIVIAAVPGIRTEVVNGAGFGSNTQGPTSGPTRSGGGGTPQGTGSQAGTASSGGTGAAAAATCSSSSASSHTPASQSASKSSPAVHASSSTPPAAHSTPPPSGSTTGTASPSVTVTVTVTASPSVTVTQTVTSRPTTATPTPHVTVTKTVTATSNVGCPSPPASHTQASTTSSKPATSTSTSAPASNSTSTSASPSQTTSGPANTSNTSQIQGSVPASSPAAGA